MNNNNEGGLWNKILAWLKSLFYNKELELSILGLQNAGKTTLVNVLANNKFDEDTIPTIGFNFRKLKKGKVDFKLWDLGGQPRLYPCIKAKAIRYSQRIIAASLLPHH